MLPRSCLVIEQPIIEPVSLSEVKAQLRLSADQTDDDRYLMGLMAAARRLVEQRMGATLIATKYRATWTAGRPVLHLPNGPVLTGEAYPVAVTADGEAVAGGDYELEVDTTPATLTFDATPSGKVVVEYWAGVEPGQQISPQIRAALLMLISHLYNAREAVSVDGQSVREVPMGFETLLASATPTGRW